MLRYFRFQTRGFQKVSQNISLASPKLNENISSCPEGTRKCPSSAEKCRHLLNPLPYSKVTVRLGAKTQLVLDAAALSKYRYYC